MTAIVCVGINTIMNSEVLLCCPVSAQLKDLKDKNGFRKEKTHFFQEGQRDGGEKCSRLAQAFDRSITLFAETPPQALSVETRREKKVHSNNLG